MTENVSMGEIFFELESRMGADTVKDLVYLQKFKKDMAQHEEAALINFYAEKRKEEILNSGGLDRFFASTEEAKNRKLEQKFQEEKKAGHDAKAIEIINALIARTRQESSEDPEKLAAKKIIAESCHLTQEAVFGQTYCVRYLYERFKLRKKRAGFGEAYAELSEVQDVMAISAPYRLLQARCLYNENRKEEAWEKLSEAFNVFLSQEEASEIYLLAAVFFGREKKSAACAAALVAAHAWAPEDEKIIARASEMDIGKSLEGENVKNILLKNKVMPMPEITCQKRLAEADFGDAISREAEENMRFVLKSAFQPVLGYMFSRQDLETRGAAYKALPGGFKAARLKKIRGEENLQTAMMIRMVSVPEIMAVFLKIRELPDRKRILKCKRWLRLIESTYSVSREQSYLFEGAAEIALFRGYEKNPLAFPGYNMAGYFAYLLGETYMKQEKFDKAVDFMEKAAFYLPASLGIKMSLIHGQIVKEGEAAALESLSDALFYASKPDMMADCYGEIAMALYLLDDCEGACAALVAARAWNPENEHLLTMMDNIADLSEFVSVKEVRTLLKERDIPDQPEKKVCKTLKKEMPGLVGDGLATADDMEQIIAGLVKPISFKRSVDEMIQAREIDF